MLKAKRPDTRADTLKRKLRTQRPVNLLIDEDLFKRFKSKAATEGKTMTDILTEFITDYLG